MLSEPGQGYVGGEAFFEPTGKILRYVDLDEIDHMRATHQPVPTDTVPTGLRRALYAFFVAAASRVMKEPQESYAFLCHVSVNKRDHQHIVNLMDRFKADTINDFQNQKAKSYTTLLKGLRDAYDDLSQTDSSMPEFDKIVEKIKFYLQGATIKLVNATSSEEIKLESVFNIFVGGNKLGRGVTIRNLLISYYGRNPKKPNSDTVLQHARMYGYRTKDLGVTRLFLPDRLAEHFRLIHQMESALRDLVKKHPSGKFEGLYISSPLQATRRNVLDPNSIGYYIAGGSYNPSYPLRTPQVTAHTKSLNVKLERFDGTSNGQIVTIDFLIELLHECKADPAYGIELWDLKIITAALEKLKVLKSLDGTLQYGNSAYLVVRRGRNLGAARRETQGILAGGEDKLAPKDAPTLFMYRQDATNKGEVEVWWPQLRFPEGNYVIAFSFDR